MQILDCQHCQICHPAVTIARYCTLTLSAIAQDGLLDLLCGWREVEWTGPWNYENPPPSFGRARGIMMRRRKPHAVPLILRSL